MKIRFKQRTGPAWRSQNQRDTDCMDFHGTNPCESVKSVSHQFSRLHQTVNAETQRTRRFIEFDSLRAPLRLCVKGGHQPIQNSKFKILNFLFFLAALLCFALPAPAQFVPPGLPPRITKQPADQIASAGDTVSLAATPAA